MAGAGYTLFVAGQVLTAAQVNTYLEQQAVMAFASAAAGDTALSAVKAEMMHRTLLDVNCDQVYSGSTWSTIGPVHGALTTWTPTVTQLGAVTVTNTYSAYSRVGRRVSFETVLSVTGTGTAANDIVLSLPVAASYVTNTSIGAGHIQDVSASNQHYGSLITQSSTTVKLGSFGSVALNAYLGSTSFTAALASGDFIKYNGTYEAAADA